MKRIADEAEVIVRLDYAEKKAHITVSSWPAMARKMEKLYGESKDGRNTAKSARWTVPLKAVRFRRLDKAAGKPLTQEAKTRLAQVIEVGDAA